MRRPPKESAESARIIGRRALVVGALQLGLAGSLLMRMRSMQLEQAEQFRLLADENRINVHLLPPARGLIFDRNGVLLAGNEQYYRVTMTREDAGDVETVLRRLSKLVPMTEEEIQDAM